MFFSGEEAEVNGYIDTIKIVNVGILNVFCISVIIYPVQDCVLNMHKEIF